MERKVSVKVVNAARQRLLASHGGCDCVGVGVCG